MYNPLIVKQLSCKIVHTQFGCVVKVPYLYIVRLINNKTLWCIGNQTKIMSTKTQTPVSKVNNFTNINSFIELYGFSSEDFSELYSTMKDRGYSVGEFDEWAINEIKRRIQPSKHINSDCMLDVLVSDFGFKKRTYTGGGGYSTFKYDVYYNSKTKCVVVNDFLPFLNDEDEKYYSVFNCTLNQFNSPEHVDDVRGDLWVYKCESITELVNYISNK